VGTGGRDLDSSQQLEAAGQLQHAATAALPALQPPASRASHCLAVLFAYVFRCSECHEPWQGLSFAGNGLQDLQMGRGAGLRRSARPRQ